MKEITPATLSVIRIKSGMELHLVDAFGSINNHFRKEELPFFPETNLIWEFDPETGVWGERSAQSDHTSYRFRNAPPAGLPRYAVRNARVKHGVQIFHANVSHEMLALEHQTGAKLQ